VPRAAAYLLDAVLRTQKPEDRVTEVLAVALREHAGFRGLVLHEAGLLASAGAEGLTAEVRTQRPTDKGRLVDLELVVWKGSGAVARLWCENKIGAEYQPNQLLDYHCALEALGGREPRCLVTIVPPERAADIESQVGELAVEVPVWTWGNVGAWAEKAGRRADPQGGGGWAGSWRQLPASADQRSLAELLWLLNRQEGVMTTELRADHAVALATYGDAVQIALGLCEQGIDRSANFRPSPDNRGGQRRGTWEYYVLEPSPEGGSWRDLGAWPELVRDQFDKFVYERTGAATIFVG
jgi:hypothetical protein